jgi:hypothetical protein
MTSAKWTIAPWRINQHLANLDIALIQVGFSEAGSNQWRAAVEPHGLFAYGWLNAGPGLPD